MISAVRWLPRGAAKSNPERFEMSPAELAMLKKANELNAETQEELKADRMQELNARDEMSDSDSESNDNDNAEEDDEFMKSLKLEKYDDEDEHSILTGASELSIAGTNMEVRDDGTDQYLELPEVNDDDSEDDEDIVIKATDNICLVGRTDDEQSTLEVYVYEDDDCTLYVHHDFPLPAFPLALEYIGSGSTQAEDNQRHNFVAVGTFQPQIEIWNLDVMDVLEPNFVCGGRDDPNPETVAKFKKYKKKKKKIPKKMKEAALLGEFKEDSHTDAVMCLGWHNAHPERLVSGSADHTVKTWDWSQGRCTSTLTPHGDKIQSLAIHPTEASMVLTGSYDRTVGMLDLRNQGQNMVKFQVDSDVEKVVWNPNSQQHCLVSCESGSLHCFDVRKADKPVFTIQAHEKAASCLAFNRHVPNLLATGSLDHTVKLWDLSDGSAKCVLSKNLDIGAIFSLDFNDPQSPFLIAAGGSKGHVAVFDTLLNRGMRQNYKQYIKKNTDHYDLDTELTKMSLDDDDDNASSDDQQ